MLPITYGSRPNLDHVQAFQTPHAAVNVYDIDGDHWLVVMVNKVHPEKTKGLLCISYSHASWVFHVCIEKLFIPLV